MAANLGLLKRLVRRAADPVTAVLALGAAAFGVAIGANPIAWLVGAGAILVFHQIALDASTAEPQELTPRQLEIAHQISEGSTDRQIAGDLGITERQVEKEVAAILAKLRRKTRAQIKNWYRRHHGDDD